MIERILPLLNRLIPQGIAMKGLAKINPRIGSFLTNATAAGYSANELMDFLREQTQSQSSEGLRPDEAAANTRVQQGQALPKAVGTAAKIGLGAGGIAAIPSVIGSMFQGQEGQPTQEQSPEQPMQNIIAQYSPELHSFIEGHVNQGRSLDEAGALAQVNPQFKKIIQKLEKDNQMPWSAILQSIYGGSQKQQQSQQPMQPQQQIQQPQNQGQGNTEQSIMAALQKVMQL